MVAESAHQRSEPAYILATPVKNEEASLPGLIRSIVNQTLRPAAWFIVDDSSDDLSPDIISQAVSEHHWIHLVKLETDTRYDLGKHYASVCMTGFDHSIAYCEQNRVEFAYVALSDADVEYPENYFANCIDFLHRNPQFGIVSGTVLVKEDGGIYDEVRLELGDGQPRGTGRVWRKEAFLATGGYIITKAPDTVSNTKALLRGWRIRQLPDTTCYQTRATGGKHGLWQGYRNKGQVAYHFGVTPVSILNEIVAMLFISRPRGRLIRSLALLCGYVRSVLRRDERISDPEIRAFFGSHRRVMRNYWLFLKGLIRRRRRRRS